MAMPRMTTSLNMASPKIFKYIYANICMYICIYIYMHIYIYTHTNPSHNYDLGIGALRMSPRHRHRLTLGAPKNNKNGVGDIGT